jgi:GH25 family lysozyme M1 (1,4-beta-N-acetylmuramidase)
MAKTIMDVSKHQGVIDWAKVKASGQIDGVMLRAMGNSAEGKPSKPYTDPQFARNYAECKRLGIPCGVYGYFKATNKAQADKELAYFRKLLTGRRFELPVAVDIEDEVQQPLGKAALTDIAAHCLSTVESWGVYALLYTGLWFGQTYLYMGGAALKAYDVWLAAYRSVKPTPGWPFGMWQYTSTAHVPGVVDATPGKTTNVDLSRAYKDYAGIIQRAGLGAVRG